MEKLDLLKFNMLEHGDTKAFDDAFLSWLLEKNKGDVEAASYEGLLMKAQQDGISLPGGLQVESSRAYWLSLAALHRPSGSRHMGRADEEAEDATK